METITKDNSFLDLRKLSEEQIKSLPQIIKDGGDKVPFEMVGNFYNKEFPYLCFLTELKIWDCCRKNFDLTELLYPDFIKLFEAGADSKTKVDLKTIFNKTKNDDGWGYMRNEIIDRISDLTVECPECENIIHSDEQYQCGTCGGGSQIFVLDWVKKQIESVR